MFQMITQSGHVPDTFLPYAETGAANIWPLPAIRYTLGWTAKYGKQRTVAHLYSRHAKADSLPSPTQFQLLLLQPSKWLYTMEE